MVADKDSNELWEHGEWVLLERDNTPEDVKEFVISVVDKAILKMMEKNDV